ncbi:MAG: thiamine pyrophosphate-dependent enzyme [Terracidiphilus sp.]|jgi:TPP-dependent pyruvate/acetoin dehydrogenase alpha subunit
MTASIAVQEMTAVEAQPGKNGFSLISSGKLIALYAAMVKCRMIGERAALLMRQGKLARHFHDAVGQEATIAGVAVDLLPEDTLSLSHGSFLAGFLAGQPLERMFSSLEAAPWNVTAPAATPADPLQTACDAALGLKTSRSGNVAVAFCGDGAARLECWRETLALAGHHELPIVLVCHNDARDEREDLTAATRFEEMADGALACGVPFITVDGNDVVAVYRVASESVARARLGRGPTLIECRAHRFHGGAGTGPESAAPLEAHDPIRNMETYLLGKGLFHAELKSGIATEFGRELDAATRSFND